MQAQCPLNLRTGRHEGGIAFAGKRTPAARFLMDRLEAAGCCRYVVTDVTKDGTLNGPNLELLRRVMDRTVRPVIASGGVATLDDIADLRELVPHGLEGAIVGKALYAKAFTLAEALDVASD